MEFKKKYTLGITAALIGLFLATQNAQATDWASAARWAADTGAKVAARAAIERITNNMIQKVLTGGINGKALFIQNWTNFLTQSQYQGENIFRAELSTAKLCDYLSTDVKKSFGVDPLKKTTLSQNTRTNSLQPFGLQTNCTLPQGFTPEKYNQDFSGNGGWDAFVRLQEPQNNAWGLSALSHDEILRQRSLSEAVNTNEALAGNGFVGSKASCKVKNPLGGDCLVPGDVKSPGSVIHDTLTKAVNAPVDFLANADGASAVISALVNIFVDNAFDLSKGKAPSTPQSQAAVTEDSYKQEFCSAKKVSGPAAAFVAAKFPAAFNSFKPSGGVAGGTGACERVRSNDNNFPYTRCVASCQQAVGLIDSSIVVPSAPPIPDGVPGDDGGTAFPPPADALTKHPTQGAIVDSVKARLQSQGADLSGPCGAFLIVKNVAWQIKASGAGLLSKPGGNNCEGYSVDIIAFPDGYIYDVLGDAGGANIPGWSPVGCGTADCSDNIPKYRPAISP